MKINPVNSIVTSYTKVQAYTAQETQRATQSSDQLELSDQAKLFTEAFAAAKRGIDTAGANKQVRVEEIMRQLEGGAYEVDISDVCNKILG